MGTTGRVIVCLAVALSGTPLEAQLRPGPGDPEPAQVTAEGCGRLAWLEGRWVGSGGGSDAFYEAFRALNDSTLEQTTYPDDRFAEPDGISEIRFRDGRIFKVRDGEVESVITGLSGDTIQLERVPPAAGGYAWIRVDDDTWRAVLERPRGEPVVYTLRRIR